MKRAQVSMEFMFAVGIILTLFLIILAFSYGRQKEIKETEEHLKTNAECQRIANLISSLHIAGPGTKVSTKINYKLYVYNTTYGSEIVVEPKNISCFYIADIENNTRLTAGQSVKIENIENMIVIKNV